MGHEQRSMRFLLQTGNMGVEYPELPYVLEA